LKVVIDADCIVAGTIAAAGAAARLLLLWQAGAFELVACRQLVEEVRDTLLRSKIAARYGIMPDEVDDLCRRIQEESIWSADPIDPARTVPEDPDDDYLVALALDGEADALVTRDRHFEAVAVAGLRIIYPGVFLAELEAIHGSSL
jgi:uncharacterized protein